LKYLYKFAETLFFTLAILAIAANQTVVAAFLTVFGAGLAYAAFFKAKKTEDPLDLINEFEYQYSSEKSALRSLRISSASSTDAIVRSSIAKYWLGGRKPGINHKNKNIRNLLEIAFFGASTGANISKSIELLKEGIRMDKQKEERVDAKAKGMNVLSKIGVTIFFPLFSGISISIIKSSMALSGNLPGQSISSTFYLIALSYTAIMLFIGKLFSNPQSDIAEALYSIMPFIAISDWILKISSTSLSSIL